MTDLINIEVRDTGTPVVARNLLDVAKAANQATQDIDLMNKALSLVGSSNPDFDKIISKAQASRVEIDKLTNSLKQQATALNAQANTSKPVVSGLNNVTAAQARMRASTTSTGIEMQRTGKSAKEIAFAMRGLPAQFTDIFVSLQGGQRPLNVLLQQGGQLKDMFGGIRPMLVNVGGAVLRMINPLTIAAAAVVALAIAWKQGSDEGVAYSKAIAQTGNYAGVTSSQLQTMAKEMSTQVNVTQHAAAQAVAAVTASGQFVGSQIATVSQAAIQMQQMTGQAIDKTIDTFAGLAGEPTKAIEKLNESQHFLTLEVYEQVRALEEQGRTQEAASLAMGSYASAVDQRAKEVQASLGYLERAWAATGRAAKHAWDIMMGIGRPKTGDEMLGQLQVAANKAAIALDALKKNGPGATGSTRPTEYDRNVYAQKLAAAQMAADATLKAYKDAQAGEVASEAEATKKSDLQRANDIAISLSGQAKTYDSALKKLNTAKATAKGKADEAYALAVKNGDQVLAKKIRDDESKVLAGLQTAYDKSLPKDHSAEKAARALEKLKNSLANVIGQTSQADEAAKKLAQAQEVLTKAVNTYDPALGHNLLTQQQADEIMKRLVQRYKDQIDPLGAMNRKMDEQTKLLELSSDARQTEIELMQRVQELQTKGKFLNDTEIGQLREKIAAQQELARIANVRDSLQEGSRAGKKKDQTRSDNAVAGLLADPNSNYTKNDAFKDMSKDLPSDTFNNTQKQRELELQQIQDYYNRINEMRKQNVISEKDAQIALSNVKQAELNKQLNATSNVLGGVAQLMNTHSKKAFKIGQAAAIAQATINAYTSATGAYASASAIPVVGWVLGPIAAAAAIAVGLANVASIRSQQMPAFRTGGSMTVGGTGGTDSQMVAFRASPGETVNINTPSQARALENAEASRQSGSTVVNQNLTMVIQGRMDRTTPTQLAREHRLAAQKNYERTR